MRTRPAPRTFASGELAPWIDGISSPVTQQGCRTLENFIVKKQGQATRRPGSFFVKEVKDSSKATVLVPVVIDDTNRYVLEIGDVYTRIFDQPTHAYNGTEITSPWSAGEVSNICVGYLSAPHTLYMAEAHHSLQQLVWTSGTSWIMGALGIAAGGKYRFIDGAGGIWSSLNLSDWEKTWIGVNETATADWVDIKKIKGTLFAISDTSPAGLYRSDDVKTWIAVTPSGMSRPKAIEVDKYGTAIIVCYTSGNIYATHDGGLTFSTRTNPTASSKWLAIGYNPDEESWRIGGTSGTAYSTDGITFTAIAVSVTDSFSNIKYGNGTWIGAGQKGVAAYLWSAGSIAAPWTLGPQATGFNYFQGLAYASYDSSPLWIAVATASTSAKVYTSSNSGTSWTAGYTFPEASVFAWASRDSYYVFGTQHYWRSRNGTTWQTGTFLAKLPLTSRNIYGIAYDTDDTIEWFDQANHFPAKLASNESRLVVGPTINDPSTLWASATGQPNDFGLGNIASDAWQYELLSNERNVDIQWMIGGMGGLVVGTRSAEGILVGSPDEGVTPLTAQFRWLSTFGSANIQPVRIHDTIVFVQRGGEIIRGYVPSANAYRSPELTEYADHIASGGILSLDHQDDPQSLVYAVRADGQLLNLAFGDGLRAWSRTKAAPSIAGDAVIESVAVIPTTGAEDEIWMIVKRTIGGATKRYIEYMDTLNVASFQAAHYLDCGVYSTSGTTFQTVGALTHLAAESVDAFISAPAANIRWITGLTVASSGTITTAPYSGTAIHVGLPYTSYLQTLRGDPGGPHGSAAGLNKKTAPLVLWVSASSALAKFGPTTTTAVETITYSSSSTLVTEEIVYPFPGQWDRDNYIWCIVSDPRPFTLVAMLSDTETGDY